MPKKPKAKPAATEKMNCSTAIIWLLIALTIKKKQRNKFRNILQNIQLFLFNIYSDKRQYPRDSVLIQHQHFWSFCDILNSVVLLSVFGSVLLIQDFF